MGQQWALSVMNYDEFLVPTAGAVTLHIGNHPNDSDTSTDRYIDLNGSDKHCLGFSITADQGISITVANNRTLKVPRPIPKNGQFTIRRGDWGDITFNTTVANTTIKVDIVG